MSGVEVTKSEDDGSQLGASAAAAAVPAAQSELEVIFHDSDIAVLNKPSGLRTVPGKAVGPEAETRAHVEWHSGTKRQRQEFWTDVVHTACESLLHDEKTEGEEDFRGHLRRLTKENNVPRKRSKFQNYTAVTLGLEGEEGDKVSARLWDAVDGHLKKEVGPGVDCLLTRVQSRWPDARHVHRLDQDTSGLVVMALTVEAAREMCRQFRERVPSKTYTAVLEGKMAETPKGGQVLARLRPDVNNRPKQMFCQEGDGNEAKTLWERINRKDDRTWVDFTPVTGRTHQIRMHALHLGHPVMGDSLYGTEEGKTKSDRLLLHARQILFPHPRTGETVKFECPPPF
ncbi:unnamed protein product [Pylaiella littoralis]